MNKEQMASESDSDGSAAFSTITSWLLFRDSYHDNGCCVNSVCSDLHQEEDDNSLRESYFGDIDHGDEGSMLDETRSESSSKFTSYYSTSYDDYLGDSGQTGTWSSFADQSDCYGTCRSICSHSSQSSFAGDAELTGLGPTEAVNQPGDSDCGDYETVVCDWSSQGSIVDDMEVPELGSTEAISQCCSHGCDNCHTADSEGSMAEHDFGLVALSAPDERARRYYVPPNPDLPDSMCRFETNEHGQLKVKETTTECENDSEAVDWIGRRLSTGEQRDEVGDADGLWSNSEHKSTLESAKAVAKATQLASEVHGEDCKSLCAGWPIAWSQGNAYVFGVDDDVDPTLELDNEELTYGVKHHCVHGDGLLDWWSKVRNCLFKYVFIGNISERLGDACRDKGSNAITGDTHDSDTNKVSVAAEQQGLPDTVVNSESCGGKQHEAISIGCNAAESKTKRSDKGASKYIKMWLVDTGCGHDLASKKALKDLAHLFEDAGTPVTFTTANGKTKADKTIYMNLGDFDEEITPYLLASTPCVLSVGRRCREYGYSFHWIGGKWPFFVAPKQPGEKQPKIILLTVVDDIPYYKQEDQLGLDQNDLKEKYGFILDKRNKLVLIAEHLSAKSAHANGYRSPIEWGTACPGEGSETDVDPPGNCLECGLSYGGNRNLKQEALSYYHQLHHKPAICKYCDSCMRGKTTDIRHIRVKEERCVNFGDIVTFDHVAMKDDEKEPGIHGYCSFFVGHDLAKMFKCADPAISPDGLEARDVLVKYRGTDSIQVVYSDRGGGIIVACNALSLLHKVAPPGDPASNGIAERANYEVLKELRTRLVQAGLPNCFWVYAAPYCAFIMNIEFRYDTTPYFERILEVFDGLQLQFGCGVWFKPAKTTYKHEKAAPRMIYGVFLGYGTGPGYKWDGTYLVGSIEDFANKDFRSSCRHTCWKHIHPHVTKRVRLPADGLRYPCKDKYEWANTTIEAIEYPQARERDQRDKQDSEDNTGAGGHEHDDDEHELNPPYGADPPPLSVSNEDPPMLEDDNGSEADADEPVATKRPRGRPPKPKPEKPPDDWHTGFPKVWDINGRAYPSDGKGNRVQHRGINRAFGVPPWLFWSLDSAAKARMIRQYGTLWDKYGLGKPNPRSEELDEWMNDENAEGEKDAKKSSASSSSKAKPVQYKVRKGVKKSTLADLVAKRDRLAGELRPPSPNDADVPAPVVEKESKGAAAVMDVGIEGLTKLQKVAQNAMATLRGERVNDELASDDDQGGPSGTRSSFADDCHKKLQDSLTDAETDAGVVTDGNPSSDESSWEYDDMFADYKMQTEQLEQEAYTYSEAWGDSDTRLQPIAVPGIGRQEVGFKRSHPDALLPIRNGGPCGLEIRACEMSVIPPGGSMDVRTGLTMTVPDGLLVKFQPREGETYAKGICIGQKCIRAGDDGELELYVSNNDVNNEKVIEYGQCIAMAQVFVDDESKVDDASLSLACSAVGECDYPEDTRKAHDRLIKYNECLVEEMLQLTEDDEEEQQPAFFGSIDKSRTKPRHRQRHREKIEGGMTVFPFPAMVARPVSHAEMRREPKAMDAYHAEWNRLREKHVWGEENVMEWDDFVRDARRSNEEAHLAYVMGLATEKGSELHRDDPNRKYKYRVVFRGDNVKNQNWEAVMFQDMGSSPATMEAAKMADAIGCAPGNIVMQADAVQAYIQAELQGPPTWVALPKDAWPQKWHDDKLRKPVCRLKKALYGHPSAGAFGSSTAMQDVKRLVLSQLKRGLRATTIQS